MFHIDKEYIANIYRELHRVPELGFDLPKSSAIIRRELDAMDVKYTEEYGRSCIIASLNEGVGTKTIAIRADFDALPIQEETGLPYASTHPGMMHACGHDAHAAMLLGTIKAMKAMENDIKCCIKFIFQSAEEILGGAKSICEDGFMDQVDEIIACHINASYKSDTFLINRTCFRSNNSTRKDYVRHRFGSITGYLLYCVQYISVYKNTISRLQYYVLLPHLIVKRITYCRSNFKIRMPMKSPLPIRNSGKLIMKICNRKRCNIVWHLFPKLMVYNNWHNLSLPKR